MNGYRELAVMLQALADWIEDSVSWGRPPKAVCREVCYAVRDLVFLARIYDDLDRWQ